MPVAVEGGLALNLSSVWWERHCFAETGLLVKAEVPSLPSVTRTTESDSQNREDGRIRCAMSISADVEDKVEMKKYNPWGFPHGENS